MTEHKHKVPEKLNHRVVECNACDLKRALPPNERWCGFDYLGQPLFDEVEPTSYYCWLCGVRGLVVATGDGDYYVGPSYYCDACNSQFTMG